MLNPPTNASLREAMRLMQTGDLMAATAEIQRRLGGVTAPDPAAAPAGDGTVIEGSFRVVDADAAGGADTTEAAAGRAHAPDAAEARTSRARFSAHVYAGPAGSRAYKLYTPSVYRGQPLPLVVMLHGCTQDPDDFAAGTRMNTAAEEHGCFVVYPAQSQQANMSRCWNWFTPGHQARDQGEPAIIAGIVRELSLQYRLDVSRIYVAGMSAGGAMAVILGRAYPDLFAAVGVHSGMPYQVARDMPSAFAAMQRGGGGARDARAGESAAAPSPMPTIVFHGDRDTTVHPGNGDRVFFEAAPARDADTAPAWNAAVEKEQGTSPRGRSYTRSIFRDAAGRVVGEHWLAHGAGHAWSGGDPRGSFTDPDGPDATAQMLRFFLERSRS